MTTQDYEDVMLLSMDKMDEVHDLLDDDRFDAYVDIVKCLEYWNQWLRGYYTALNSSGWISQKNISEFKSRHMEADVLCLSLLATLKKLGLN